MCNPLKFLLCSLFIEAMSSGLARAEFQISGNTVLTFNHEEPRIIQGPRTARLRPPSQKPISAIAQGFGHQVPLAFAILQVVPKNVAVTFSNDLDPDEVIVDWQGGQPWPEVLRTLLRQSGLLVTFKPNAVAITRPPT